MTTTTSSQQQHQQQQYKVPSPPEPTTFHLRSPRGAHLATRVWAPKIMDDVVALCLLVHGGGWHSGYFHNVATYLNQYGIYCASYDQVNCGYSDPEPDTPALGVVHIRNFDCLVEDVCEAISWMQKEANNTTAPVFLFGESFGALQILAAAFDRDSYSCKIDGVIISGGLLQVNKKFLPPQPVVIILVWLAQYYPKLIMPATDFESTFDEAFGDRTWAKIARSDPKVTMQIKATIGSIAATLGTGSKLQARASDFPVPLYAIHGKGDGRTSPEAIQEFVDRIGPTRATMDFIDTTGHQLLQDMPDKTNDVHNKIKDWILSQVKRH